MSQEIKLQIKGLYTHPNPLNAPEGSLSVADNIVINADNQAEPRRGYERLDHQLSNVNDRITKLITYQNKLICHYNNDTLAYSDGISWTDYSGTIIAPTSEVIRTAQSNSNFYFTSSDGIKALDIFNGAPYDSGMPKALDGTATLSGASGFMTHDSQVAYRVLWGRKDLNNNLILGAPSSRITVANSSGGTRDVSLEITIPSGITTNDFIQIYRSGESVDANTESNDELQLVYEANPTSGEITAGNLTVVDSTPDSLRGATLYSSPSQEGALQENNSPPLSKDISLFKNMMFYANVESSQRLFFTILSVGGSSGVQLDDVITIAGNAYTWKATETIASGQPKLSTGGTPAQNIADSAKSLVRVINRYASNTLVYAYYLSGYNDLPGKILIESRSLGASTFSIIASARGAAFNPSLPTSGTSVSSANDIYENGVYVSKLQQPEAVPLTNLLFVGNSSPIQRIVSLRDSLLIFKDDGFYRIIGDNPQNLRVEQIDNSTRLLAKESCAILNNQVFCLTDQGVCSVSDSGVQVLSRPIESTLLELQGISLSGVKNYSWGVGYESDRKYILSTITSSGDTYTTQMFVFNVFTSSWTRWDLSKACGIVNPVDDKLYFANADSKFIVKERKSYSFRDFIDEGDTYSLSSYSDTNLVLTSISGIEIGDLIYESSSIYALVESIDVVTNSVIVNSTKAWTLGSVTIYKAIDTAIEWLPITGQNPGVMKHFRDCILFFRNSYFETAQIGFKTDFSGSLNDTNIIGTIGGLWGLFPWGSGLWGGNQRPTTIRTLVPLEKSRCFQLTLRFSFRQGYSQFQLNGASLMFDFVSERVR